MRLTTAIILTAAMLLAPAALADDAKPKAPAAKGDAADNADPARKALDKQLPEVVFDNVQLGDVVDFLRDVSGATIWLDRQSLKAAEIDPTKTFITMKVKKGQTFKEALASLTKRMVGSNEEKSVVEACGGVVVISTEAGAKSFVDRHRKALARVGKDAPRLDRKLPEVTFTGVPLADVIDFLRDVTAANIEVDWKALAATGVQKNAPVSVRARGVKFSRALRLILDDVAAADKPLEFAARGDRIIITEAPAVKEAEKKLAPQEGL